LPPFTLNAICGGLLFAVPEVAAGAETIRGFLGPRVWMANGNNKTEIDDGTQI
jgi:hypothetical protein